MVVVVVGGEREEADEGKRGGEGRMVMEEVVVRGERSGRRGERVLRP